MKWVNGYRKSLMLFVFVAAIVLGGGEPSNADFTFGTPTNLGSAVNTSAREEEPYISPDGLSLYYCSLQAGGYGNYDLWVTSRLTTKDDWGPPINLGPMVNSSSADFTPEVSADGLMLYFVSDRPGGYGSYDLWVTRRATKQDDWGTPVNLGLTVNKTGMDACMAISDDGLELYFWSDRSGGYGSSDIWVTRRTTIEDVWGMPVNLGPIVNSSATELCSDISGDGLLLFFVSKRSGGYGGNYGDIWISRRATTSDPWGSPVNLGPMVNTSSSETGPALSADGSILYFGSDRPGGFGSWDIWQVIITLVVDFNGDGIIDAADMFIMIDHWGENYSLCDIAPTPFGDGIVDVQDLIVLAKHLFEEPGLTAYWTLDESQGVIAYDSIADCNGTLIGGPVWQHDAGMVAGALQLDGIDDCIITDFVLNPVDGPFSVLAWIKGGASGQVVLSQFNKANWLRADTDLGCLTTELMPPVVGRFVPQPLKSESVITDGEWHRIGFVWDGSNRALYVDDILVAEDAQANLQGSDGGLYIGTGKAMEPGTYWSGLIDDVRIYNRVVRP